MHLECNRSCRKPALSELSRSFGHDFQVITHAARDLGMLEREGGWAAIEYVPGAASSMPIGRKNTWNLESWMEWMTGGNRN